MSMELTDFTLPNERPKSPSTEPHIFFSLGVLILASIPGALIRIGLQQLFTFSGVPLNPVVIPQMVGCFIAGLVHHSPLLSS